MPDPIYIRDVNPQLADTKAASDAKAAQEAAAAAAGAAAGVMSNIQGYTERFSSPAIPAAILASREVLWGAPVQLGPGKAMEVIAQNGVITFPADVEGRWSVNLSLDIAAGIDLAVEGRCYDAAGNLMTKAQSGYPKKARLSLSTGGDWVAPGFPPIPKAKGAAMTFRLFLTSTLAVGINSIDLNLTKFP